jgi:hypothetical protein
MGKQRKPVDPQETGALAMMEKLTRLWLPQGTPREKIYTGFDGSRYKNLCQKWLREKEEYVASLSAKMHYNYGFLLDDKERKRLQYDGIVVHKAEATGRRHPL